MSNNQTPKARVIAARPGAYSERVESNGQPFTRILHNGTVIGQGVTPNKAWQVAALYIETQDKLKATKQAPVTPPQRLVTVPTKVKQARRNRNRIARASRKRNRAA